MTVVILFYCYVLCRERESIILKEIEVSKTILVVFSLRSSCVCEDDCGIKRVKGSFTTARKKSRGTTISFLVRKCSLMPGRLQPYQSKKSSR